MGNKVGGGVAVGPGSGSHGSSPVATLSEIDLSGKGFASFPMELKETLVQLSHSNPTALAKIYVVNLSSNKMEDIEDLKGLVSVKILDVSRNKIRFITTELIASWKNLESIDLSNNLLVNLPLDDKIILMNPNLKKTLTSIQASNNQIAKLPDELGELSALKTLNLSYNKLTKIKNSWNNLSSLQTLHLNNNAIVEVSGDALISMTNVALINLANNKLQSLPFELSKLSNLTKLYLNNNMLTQIPSYIGQLRSLKEFNLRNNKLTDLPSELSYLWKLSVLDIEENPWPREEFYFELPELLAFLSENPRPPPSKNSVRKGSRIKKGSFIGNKLNITAQDVGDTSKPSDEFEVQAYKNRLFHVKGKQDILVREVECKYQSFNQGDVFVLDAGSVIFVWMGTTSNDRERAKACFFARKLSEEECGGAHVLELDAANNEDSPLFSAALEFWEQVGGKINIADDTEGGDDEEAEAVWPSINRLFKVIESGDRVDIMVVEDDLLTRDLLDSDHCFVLDCYACTFVWAGATSTPNEKSWAMLKAEELQSRPRPASTGVVWVMDGDERITFRENFFDWVDPDWEKEISIVKHNKENKKKLLKSIPLEELLASPANTPLSSPLQPNAVIPAIKARQKTIEKLPVPEKHVSAPVSKEKKKKEKKPRKHTPEVKRVPSPVVSASAPTSPAPSAPASPLLSLDASIKSEAQKQSVVQASPFSSIDAVIKRDLNKQQDFQKEERERQAKQKEQEIRDRIERERLENERYEQERLEKARQARERTEREKAEKERTATGRAEIDRAEKERAAKEKAEKERADRDRSAKEKAEKERAENDRAEKERAAKEKAEKDRLAAEAKKAEETRIKETSSRQEAFKAELQRKESQAQLDKEAEKKKEEQRLAALEKEKRDKENKEDIERLEAFRREVDGRLDSFKEKYKAQQEAEKKKKLQALYDLRTKCEKEREKRDAEEFAVKEAAAKKEREERERQEREAQAKKAEEERIQREKEEKARKEKEERERKLKEEEERNKMLAANETPAETRERLRREREERETKLLKEQQARIEQARKEREEQERKAKEDKERAARERAELMAKLEADRKAREERERQERLARRRAAEANTAPKEEVSTTRLTGPTRAAGPKRRTTATRNPVRALAERAAKMEAENNASDGPKLENRAAVAGAAGLLWSVGGENALALWKKKSEERKTTQTSEGGKPQRLYHIKGRRNPFVREVEFSIKSLNEGDVFVLDNGGAILYQWNGCEANRIEKGKGLDFAKKLKDKEHQGRPKIVVLEQKEIDSDHHFYKLIGGSNIDPANAGGDDQEAERNLKGLTTLYIVNSEGAASVDDIELEVIEEYPLMKEMLESHLSYILDCVGEIFPWTGKKSSVPSRNAAMSIAKKMAESRDFWCAPIKRELEGGESVIFKEKFANWSNTLPIQMKQVVSGMNTAPTKKIEKFDAARLHQPPPMKEEVMIDDGSGTPQVWRVEGNQKIAVPAEELGQFYSGESYVIMYKYTFKNKDQYLLYFWQGRDSSVNEKGTSALMTIQLDESLGRVAKEIRVVQNKEPQHFIAIFKNRIVIHRGKANSSRSTTRLYQITEANASGKQLRAAEIWPTATALNSLCSFVLTTEKECFVWLGKASSSLERTFALEQTAILGNNLKKPVKQITEGSETNDFWTAIKGKKRYPIANRVVRRPHRLFQCSIGTGSFEVHEIFNFCADDLVNDDVMMLDAYDEVFIWIGRYAHESEKKLTMETAIDYVATLPPPRTPVPIIVVFQPDEPLIFTAYFFAWDSKDKELSYDAGIEGVEDVLDEYGKQYTYEELRAGFYPKSFDESKLEMYLSDSEFKRAFGMTREEFAQQTSWKKEDMKKALGLY